MNKDQREIQRKLRILRHAEEFGHVAKTCRYSGIGRASFTWHTKPMLNILGWLQNVGWSDAAHAKYTFIIAVNLGAMRPSGANLSTSRGTAKDTSVNSTIKLQGLLQI